MYKFIHGFVLLLAFFVLQTSVQAQKVKYSDHKPNYTKWQNIYTIDKIQYKKDKTIFYLRFVHEYDTLSGISSEIVFHPTGDEYTWYLKDVENGTAYELLEIRNVYRNKELVSELVSTAEFRSSASDNENTIFTCEAHFPRLPETVKSFDLIEGRGKENAKNHFNCFAVEHKLANSKDLGRLKDSKKNIKLFNKKYIVKSQKRKNKK
jgi:hypothetical protein